LIALSGILKEGILLLVRSDGTHTNYRGREGREHPEYYLKNSMSSPDTMRTPKKSRNLSFTQYNTQYEEQEKKKQRRGEDAPTNIGGLRSRQNSNNNNGDNSINNSYKDGNISRKTSISRGNSNISTMNHGNSNVSCENNGFHEDSQSNISTIHRNINSSRFKSDENDRTRIASSNGNGSSSGGISYSDPDGGEEGSHGDRDREGEEGGVEMWAMSLIGESTRYYTVRYCAALYCTVIHSAALHTGLDCTTLPYCQNDAFVLTLH
jgi:hypothetical protein